MSGECEKCGDHCLECTCHGIKIDCIADLHGHYPKLEGGDLLIVCGDLTATHTYQEWHKFVDWLHDQNYTKIVFIAGNHDTMIEKWDREQDSEGYLGPVSDATDHIEYLCDSGTEFEGLKVWGTPWTARFQGMNPKCMAFTYADETWFYDEKVTKIPVDTDILITHGPARGCLDKTVRGEHVGSSALEGYLRYVMRPKVHIFGHVHEAYGQEEKWNGHNGSMVKSINASHVNDLYKPVNAPVRIIL